MTLGFRGGGFGTPGFGPFRTGGGDFSRYNIGDDGAQLDAAKRDAAVIAWGNGTITDEAYLAALRTYWQRQSRDDPRWLSARDDYEDAVYSIGRNERVRKVNNAASARERLAALDALIGFDQRRLRTMTARGRNEQARELSDRIADAEGQIRETRYGEQVRRYNSDRLTTDEMLAAARRMARDSRGAPDHETWNDRVTEWENRQWDERYATAQDVYQRTLVAEDGNIRGAGNTLIEMLEQRLSRMGQGTPGRTQMERALRDTRERVTEDVWNRRIADAEIAVREGDMGSGQYIAILYDRVRAMPQGSRARKEAQAKLLNDTYVLGEQRIRERLALPKGHEDHLDPFEAVPFYQGYLATMSPGTERYREIQAQITALKLDAVQAVPLTGKPEDVRDTRGGHWILPSRGPLDGTAGFTSQFDGSAFASQNCVYAAGAMMFDGLGGADLSGADLRRYAGDNDGAGFQSDLQRAYERLGFAVDRYNGMSFRQFTKRLDSSQAGAVVIGLLSSLPRQFRLSSSGTAHAVYVTKETRVVDGVRMRWVMDPLGRSGYTGQWWPEEVLQEFAWSGARNPISGNAIYGSVVFGKRTGRSNVRSRPAGYQPRFQAFDTDAHGRSTVGRGGGTSREEAGPVTDWSKQKDRQPPKGSPLRGEKGVSAFLEAVGKVTTGPTLDESGRDVRGTREEQETRARALMSEYKGDARLMTLAWFGRAVEADTTLWSDSDRWYVNAVAGRLGYAKVPPQGIGTIVAGKPAAPDPGPVVRGQASPGTAGEVLRDARTTDVDEAMPVASGIARQVLDELGLPQTRDMERAVTAWMRTESPQDTVQGNNPFGIMTPGPHDLPGQIGVDANGRAVFDSLDSGIRAATADLEADYPDIVAAGRSGNPERFLTELSRSEYREGGYGSSLVVAYNQTPGDGLMIGGPGAVLDVPTDLGDLSGRHPDVAELFRVDPSDPAQVEWYERNMANARAAMDSGSAKWAFITPDERIVQLDFTPQMAAQLVATRSDYYRLTGDDKEADATRRLSLSLMGDIAIDDLDLLVDGLERTRQKALSEGDLVSAMNASLDKVRAVHELLGVPVGEELDIDALRGAVPGFATSDYDHLVDIIESVDPDSPTGDPLLKAVDKDYVTIQKGPNGTIIGADANPEVFYVRQAPDGTADVRIYGEASRAEFELTAVYTDENGDLIDEPRMVPAYQQSNQNVWVPSKGMWVPVQQVNASGGVLDYAGYRKPVPGFVGAEPTVINPLPPAGLFEGTILDSFGDLIAPAVRGIVKPDQGEARNPRTLRELRTPQDALIVSGVAPVPAMSVEIVNPDTGAIETWLSLDGKEWVGGPRDRITDKPPMFVLNADSGIELVRTADRTYLARDGQPIPTSELTAKFYADNFHIRGTRPEDNPNPYAPPFRGAEGAFYKVVRGAPAPGGGFSLDTTAPDIDPEVQRWRDVQQLPHIFGQFARQESGMARVRRDAAERFAPNLSRTTTIDAQRREALATIRGTGRSPSLITPAAKAGPDIRAMLGRWRSGASSAPVANSTARSIANARATLAAAERARASRAAQAAAQQRRIAAPAPKPAPSPRPTPRPIPSPVGSVAPTPPPRRDSQFTPRKNTSPGSSQSSMNQRRQGTVKPKPAPSPSPPPPSRAV